MRRRQPDPIEVQQMRQEANVRRAEAEIARWRLFNIILVPSGTPLKLIAFRQRVEKEKKERELAQQQQKTLEEEKEVKYLAFYGP